MFRRKLRVRVETSCGNAIVGLRRAFQMDYGSIVVARINLEADDADLRLAEARMKAKDMADQLNGLES